MDPDRAVRVAAHDAGRLLRVVEIAEHHRRAGDADLAHLVVAQLLERIRPEHGHGGFQQRDADRAVFVHVIEVAARGGADLAHAVALRERIAAAAAVQKAVELVLQPGIHRVAAGTGSLEKRQVHFSDPRVVHQPLVVRRDSQRVRRAVAPDHVREFLRVEQRDEHDLQPKRKRHVQAAHDAVGRERRDDIEKAVVAAVIDAREAEVHAHGIHAVVREHDPLGHAGRAAGVVDDGEHILPVRHGPGIRSRARAQKIVPVDDALVRRQTDRAVLEPLEQPHHRRQRPLRRLDDDRVHIQLRQHVQILFKDRVKDHQHARAGLGHEIADAFAARARVDHVRHAADLVEPVERIDRLRDRQRAARHDLARQHTERLIGVRRAVDLAQRTAERNAVAVIVERGVVRIRAVLRHEIAVERVLRQRRSHGLRAEIFQPRFALGRARFYLHVIRKRIHTDTPCLESCSNECAAACPKAPPQSF